MSFLWSKPPYPVVERSEEKKWAFNVDVNYFYPIQSHCGGRTTNWTDVQISDYTWQREFTVADIQNFLHKQICLAYKDVKSYAFDFAFSDLEEIRLSFTVYECLNGCGNPQLTDEAETIKWDLTSDLASFDPDVTLHPLDFAIWRLDRSKRYVLTTLEDFDKDVRSIVCCYSDL